MAPDCIARLHACADGEWDLPPDVDLVIGALAPVRVGRQVDLERACRAIRRSPFSVRRSSARGDALALSPFQAPRVAGSVHVSGVVRMRLIPRR